MRKEQIIQEFCNKISSKYDVAIDIGQYNSELNIYESTDIYGSDKTLRKIINEILFPAGFECDNLLPPLPGTMTIGPLVPDKIGCLWVCIPYNGFAIIDHDFVTRKSHGGRPNLWNERFDIN